MKKILLATTMLAGTAGFAAAEVAVSGYAEMGIWSNAAGDVQFWEDVDVTFTMSGTTDGGLEFGVAVDLDEAPGLGATGNNGTAAWISGAFGKLTLGDTDGALDWALADMDGGLTSIADDHTTHIAFFGGSEMDGHGDNQVARYENTFGQVSFAISAEQIGNGATGGDEVLGVGVKYSADLGGTTVNLGLGYQEDSTDSAWGVSAGAALAGGFTGKIGYMEFDNHAIDNKLGLELTYVSGPIGVSMNYGDISWTAGGSDDSWGLAANYDLGGGAKVMFGYGSDVSALAGSQDQWSLGLGMSF